MYTYQDFLNVKEVDRLTFVRSVIDSHRRSEEYESAMVAREYYKQRNKTIVEYQKLLYTVSGTTVPDNYSANYKLCSGFFRRFTIQQNQHLLGNGVTFSNKNTKAKLGDKFDTQLQKLGIYALVEGVAFGYWNATELNVFRLTEFAPLYDEETGAIMAGVRFWQLDKTKPLRATLYELDGYTDIVWKNGEATIIGPKTRYVKFASVNQLGDEEDVAWENYPSFPVIPLWANENHQSELVGIREQIDAYDLIKSGFASDLDDASQIYWTIQNAGGMDDVDLAQFVHRMKTLKATVVDPAGASAESHTIDVPYAARETILTRLRSDLYDDYMALDTKAISGGATTATQIQAAYEPLNSKTDMFEYQVRDFLQRLGVIVGEDLSDASFTRSTIVNAQEMISNLTTTAQYLSEDYVTKKVLELFGDGDLADDILKQMSEGEINRWRDINEE